MSMNLANTIYDLRREKGYTQEKLAEMLGVTTAAVSKWECANAYPDITLLPQLAEIFDVSMDYLFGYNITERKTIPEVIAEANRLSKKLDRDGSVALIAKTLARYPNNNQLIFELARHKFINARYKNKSERDILLSEAAEGFETVTKNTDDENRRAWAYHFLTTIALVRRDYDKARFWNSKIIGGRGLYPKADRAIIEMKQNGNLEAMRLAKETMYESVFEFSIVLPWVVNHHLVHNEPDKAINETKRAVRVLADFNDSGLFFDTLSKCSESIAWAYAMKGEYDSSFDYLEKAYFYAEQYDKQEYGFVYNVYGMMDETAEMEEKLSSRKSLLRALLSDERGDYTPIRENVRFKEIVRKLSEN